jgi:hypothetical protein
MSWFSATTSCGSSESSFSSSSEAKEEQGSMYSFSNVLQLPAAWIHPQLQQFETLPRHTQFGHRFLFSQPGSKPFCWNHSTGFCITLNYWALFLTALHSGPTWSLGRYYVLGEAHRWEEGTQNKVHTQDSSQEQASNSGNASIQQPYLACWPVRDFFHI